MSREPNAFPVSTVQLLLGSLTSQMTKAAKRKQAHARWAPFKRALEKLTPEFSDADGKRAAVDRPALMAVRHPRSLQTPLKLGVPAALSGCTIKLFGRMAGRAVQPPRNSALQTTTALPVPPTRQEAFYQLCMGGIRCQSRQSSLVAVFFMPPRPEWLRRSWPQQRRLARVSRDWVSKHRRHRPRPHGSYANHR